MAQAPEEELTIDGKKQKFTHVIESGQTSDVPAMRTQEVSDIYLSSLDEFTEIQLEDYEWKVKSRKTYGSLLIGLLIAQNATVFILVFLALIFGRLQDLQLIFGLLVSATLIETAFMIQVIVKWLFRDINYPTS